MGASYVSRTYNDCSIEELKKKVKHDCQDDAYECGHGGYTGTWAEKLGEAVCVHKGYYGGKKEADDYVRDNADKWGELIAVQYVASIDDNKVATMRWLVGAWCSE